MLNLIFKNYKKYHENQRKKLRRLIYISSKSNFDAQTLLNRFRRPAFTVQSEHDRITTGRGCPIPETVANVK